LTVLIFVAVGGVEALDADAGVQVAEHVEILAGLVRCAGHDAVAEMVGAAGFPLGAVAVLHTHDAQTRTLIANQLAGAVFGGDAHRRNALSRIVALQPRIACAAVALAAVAAAFLAVAVRCTNLAPGVLRVAFGDLRLPVHVDGRLSTAAASGQQEGGEKKWGCSLHHALLRWFCSFLMG